ncbi:MAG: galactose mutarotase [Gemmatimonadota bacterium]|nr:galactose mutarotase [Gemmatimonadota bacterium]
MQKPSAILLAVALAATAGEANVSKDSFGTTAAGQPVDRYTLTNDRGTIARVITYGGIITELLVRDRAGALGDVVLGFDRLEQYEKENPYFGCITGRVANRIAGGKFSLDGQEYTLAVNNGPNHLHGGIVGFDKIVWDAEVVDDKRGPAVRLHYVSQDGEEGYPGTVPVSVTYTLTHDDELVIAYEATTDKPTPINLTNHSYFNLAGSGPVLGHILTLHTRYYTEPDANQIPTGRILPIAGTPLDFVKPTAIGGRIGQIADIGGYDHNYVLDNGGRAEPGLAAEVYEPESGRVMELYTTEPGVQFYSAIHLDGVMGKGGTIYNQYHGLCLETQHYPDSINQPGFPSVVLRPGETYRTVTIHKFSTR